MLLDSSLQNFPVVTRCAVSVVLKKAPASWVRRIVGRVICLCMESTESCRAYPKLGCGLVTLVYGLITFFVSNKPATLTLDVIVIELLWRTLHQLFDIITTGSDRGESEHWIHELRYVFDTFSGPVRMGFWLVGLSCSLQGTTMIGVLPQWTITLL